MKVLHLNTSDIKGGAARAARGRDRRPVGAPGGPPRQLPARARVRPERLRRGTQPRRPRRAPETGRMQCRRTIRARRLRCARGGRALRGP